MTNVNITRHDRGLDAKRIEKIVGMIHEKISDIKYDNRDVLRNRRKELKADFIKVSYLQPEFDAIQTIQLNIDKLEEQIKALKEQQKPHKQKIAEQMKGNNDTYSYAEVRDDSPADKYIEERLPDMETIKTKLTELDKEMEEQLWLAKDIEEARDLYNLAMSRIEEISNGLEKTK